MHPNDLGFQYYADALSSSNLVVEGEFEDGCFAWQDLGNTATDPDAHAGAQALRIGPGLGGVHQHLGRVKRQELHILRGHGKVIASGDSGRFGVSFHDPAGVELSRRELKVASLGYRKFAMMFKTPAVFASARLFCTNDLATSVVLLDDLELIGVVKKALR